MFDDQLTESREKAKRLIMAGKVRVNDQVARKPSDQVKPEDRIEVEEPEKFVSRGGFKLEKALETLSMMHARSFSQKSNTRKTLRVIHPIRRCYTRRHRTVLGGFAPFTLATNHHTLHIHDARMLEVTEHTDLSQRRDRELMRRHT